MKPLRLHQSPATWRRCLLTSAMAHPQKDFLPQSLSNNWPNASRSGFSWSFWQVLASTNCTRPSRTTQPPGTANPSSRLTCLALFSSILTSNIGSWLARVDGQVAVKSDTGLPKTSWQCFLTPSSNPQNSANVTLACSPSWLMTEMGVLGSQSLLTSRF